MKRRPRVALVLLSMLVITGAFSRQAPKQFGDNYRPDYETFRPDKIVEQGDISYSGDLGLAIPLLTIPGRHNHGYVISLSYSSNITQRQVASWVGLGWTLDIGGVERSVIGRSDDQPQGLHPGENLGPDNSNPTPPWRSEMVGRLSLQHPSIQDNPPHLFKDQVDEYRLIIDGASLEMLPFPLDVNKSDTLDQHAFCTLQWRPWSIEAMWIEGQQSYDQLTYFDVTKEDGTIYHFGGLDAVGGIDYVTVTGTNEGGTQQTFRFPYRWNLTKITHPDGCEIRIAYRKHNDVQTKYGKKWESLIIDRYAGTGSADEKNLFGAGAFGIPQGQILYEFSSPETVLTNTHYAYFKSSTPTADSTARNRRLDEIIMYERASGVELKRAVFTYAANTNPNQVYNLSGSAPGWSSGQKLNNDQLTLTSLTIRSGSTPGTDELPPYKFTYHENPKVDPGYQITQSSADPTFPGYHTDPVFGRAWKLKDLTLPTGGVISYDYQTFDVRLDPEGNEAVAPSAPFSYKGQRSSPFFCVKRFRGYAASS